jgi:hypothetical protein
VKKLTQALLAVALLLAAPAVRAQHGTSRWGSVELGAGPYIPNIDTEFSSATPYRDVFGGAPAPMFRLHVAKSVWSGAGSLEVGIRTGFWRKSGHALVASGADAGQPSADRTAFNIIPTSLTLTYRADQLYERAYIPLVPYLRGTLERYNWWVTKEANWTEHGGTNGWSATAGMALILDFLDPGAARDLDNDSGVNHTALYFDVTRSKVDDFGSKKSWDLSEKNKLFWSGGLLLVF